MSRRKGLAFGFLPVWIETDHIEARYWWADLLFEPIAAIWGFCCFLGGIEPEGFPVSVKDGDE